MYGMARPKGRRQDKREPKSGLVVATWISPGLVHQAFMVSMLTNVLNEPRLQGFASGSSPRINRVRNQLVQNFMDTPKKFEWLWMVDTDMVLPPNALSTLLSTAKKYNRKLVGGLAYIFKPDEAVTFLPSMLHHVTDEAKELLEFSDGEDKDMFIINKPPTKRFIEVDSTGFFCMLVHRSLLEAVDEAYAHKGFRWINEEDQGAGDDMKGPDVEFYERIQKATGVTPLIDASVQPGHIKEFTITHELAVQSYHGLGWEQFVELEDNA